MRSPDEFLRLPKWLQEKFGDSLEVDEAWYGLQLARRFERELPYLIQVSYVLARQIKEQGFADCYVWSQAAFEIGLNYEQDRLLTRADVEERLNLCLKTCQTPDMNLTYWLAEINRCRELLSNL